MKKKKKPYIFTGSTGPRVLYLMQYLRLLLFMVSAIMFSDRLRRQSELMSTLKLLLSFFQAEDGIRDTSVTGVQTCALPISAHWCGAPSARRNPEPCRI